MFGDFNFLCAGVLLGQTKMADTNSKIETLYLNFKDFIKSKVQSSAKNY